MDVTPHMETLRVIRRITADGMLTMEEVWDLAGFLNNHRTARNEWPGNVLWPTLQSVFDDGVVDEEEMAALGTMLSEVSLQAANMSDLGLTTYIRLSSQRAREESPSQSEVA